MIVDAHQHYWRIDRGDYHWMSPDLKDLYRDFLPEDLAPELDACNVYGSMIVQAAETEAETKFLLDIAKADETVLGVVGWVDMEAANVADRLDYLIEYGKGYLKGVRPMIQDIADPDWVVSARLDHAFRALEERGLTFDALVYPMHLQQLESRLQRHPDLKCVIDHGAKPSIAENLRSAWSSLIASIARNTSAYCKLSGLVTEAGNPWVASDIKPYAADLLYHFGADRLLWGSDWPVLNITSDYRSWFSLAQECCQRLSSADRDRVFGMNASQVYGLGVTCLR